MASLREHAIQEAMGVWQHGDYYARDADHPCFTVEQRER
jgi:hypothetical protein